MVELPVESSYSDGGGDTEDADAGKFEECCCLDEVKVEGLIEQYCMV